MKARLLAIACAALCAAATAAPLDALKGKVKPGMYEYKMDTDMGTMPGVPPNMSRQTRTFQHCVTAKEVEQGLGRASSDKGDPPPCEVKNFSQSGNSATYTMVCKDMTADTKMTFTGAGFNMDTKVAMNQGGNTMKMTQRMEGKYLGPCK